MLDLHYVHPTHPLASHIIQYYGIYSQLPLDERFVWVIEANARLIDLIVNQLSSLKNNDNFFFHAHTLVDNISKHIHIISYISSML